MLDFPITYQRRQFQIVFTIGERYSDLQLQLGVRQYQINTPFITLAILEDLLRKQVAKLTFSLEDLQLQIVVPLGKVKRYIYLPLQHEDAQKNRAFIIKAMERWEQWGQDASLNANKEMTRLKVQLDQAIEDHGCYRDAWCEKKCAIRSYEESIAILAQQDLRLNRQIIAMDEEIMASKRGIQLEQYRLSTISENRQERKKKVYFSELSKLSSPKIHKAIREGHAMLRLQLGQCELKSMKFVEVFEGLHELRLGRNMIKKIEGLGPLVQLRKVELQGNVIERMEGFNNNTEIRQLRLQRNRIGRLENIFHLCRLEILSLSQNSIEEIPKDIKLLEGLVELRMIGNNVTHLPSELLTLNKLRTLSINGNPCAKETQKSREILKKLATAKVDTSGTAL